ncbi:hypothetical protein BGZ54_005267 [Gamsiella multidivaricata]|nr:hypothetical protein BGZ54_005267 [Gamsiella multidivaricata]
MLIQSAHSPAETPNSHDWSQGPSSAFPDAALELDIFDLDLAYMPIVDCLDSSSMMGEQQVTAWTEAKDDASQPSQEQPRTPVNDKKDLKDENCTSSQDGIQAPDSQSTSHEGCDDAEGDEPLIRLEITELTKDHQEAGDHHHTQPRPRQFTFQKDAHLLLGRAPSSSSDPQTRLRRSVDKADRAYGQAQADNGLDDGLFSNQVISRIHAVLYEMDGNIILEDRHSTHGTYVNDQRIESRVLQDDDQVRLGRHVIRNGLPYLPLEFIVRIQGHEENEAWEEEADVTATTEVNHSLVDHHNTSTTVTVKAATITVETATAAIVTATDPAHVTVSGTETVEMSEVGRYTDRDRIRV